MGEPLLKDAGALSFSESTMHQEVNFSVVEIIGQNGFERTSIYDLASPLERAGNSIFKRFFDLFFSSFFILLLFPLLLPVVAFCIRLTSKGPIFFLQKRGKKDGGLFTCIKFRTMVVNNEADTLPALYTDDRITKVGRFLRRTHLDELPQLFNVWMGDMSIIGPRPHMITDNEKFETQVPFYHFRHKVKPGITGLAQVSGCAGPIGDVENIRQRVEKDIYYIHNWSAALDTKIALYTFFKMIGIKPGLVNN